jgi:hypothetical protein
VRYVALLLAHSYHGCSSLLCFCAILLSTLPADRIAHAESHAHSDTDAHADPNAHADGDAHADAHSHAHPNGDAFQDAHKDSGECGNECLPGPLAIPALRTVAPIAT